MITLTLTTDQARQVRAGSSEITVYPDQARAWRGKLSAAMRTTHGAPKITCDCGTCAKCKMREYQRVRRRRG